MRNVIIIIIFLTIFIASCSSASNYSKATLDSLADCLSQKNVKEYGAFWCPNCAKQEKLFGQSHKILRDKGVYIECDPKCVRDQNNNLPVACRGVEGKPQECIENDVTKYPTWVFPDASRLIGVQDLDVLAQKAGCTIQEGS